MQRSLSTIEGRYIRAIIYGEIKYIFLFSIYSHTSKNVLVNVLVNMNVEFLIKSFLLSNSLTKDSWHKIKFKDKRNTENVVHIEHFLLTRECLQLLAVVFIKSGYRWKALTVKVKKSIGITGSNPIDGARYEPISSVISCIKNNLKKRNPI